MPPAKITEPVRSARLRRPLVPSVTRDSDIPGFCLIVTRKRSFWALIYQPHGTNPRTGRRWGGGMRHELGDAMVMTVKEARSDAAAAKLRVAKGYSPHHEAMASRATATAERAILPSTVGDALDLYATTLMARRQPSEATRRQALHYAKKAVRLMNAQSWPYQ